ncbi:MAG: glycosyl transferase, partial [Rhodospirillaceae bacterium]|nr:glycosyl transferase [Rhodospirillaceae bacterium]
MQVLPSLNSGGVERGTLEISKALITSGWKSIVVSQGGSMVNQLKNEGGI